MLFFQDHRRNSLKLSHGGGAPCLMSQPLNRHPKGVALGNNEHLKEKSQIASTTWLKQSGSPLLQKEWIYHSRKVLPCQHTGVCSFILFSGLQKEKHMKTVAPRGRIKGPIVADYIIDNKKISSDAKLLYAVLCRLCGDKDHCWPSQSYLADVLGCSVTSIKKYIAELVNATYIFTRQGVWGRSSMYFIVDQEEMENESEKSSTDQPSSSRSMSSTSHTMASQNLAALNNKNIKNTIYPLPPQSTQSAKGPLASPRSGRIAPCEGGVLSAAYSAFDQVWNVWPIQQDRYRAQRVWLRLFKAGELPKIDSLMAIIANLKANDGKWQRDNGRYVPLLTNWLQGRRWLDVPTPIAPSPQSDASTQIAASIDPQLLERTRTAYEAMEARVQQPAPASPLPRQELWQKALDTYSLPAHQRGMAAGLWRYLHSKNSLPAELDMTAPGFVEWLQACAAEACPHAPWAGQARKLTL